MDLNIDACVWTIMICMCNSEEDIMICMCNSEENLKTCMWNSEEEMPIRE